MCGAVLTFGRELHPFRQPPWDFGPFRQRQCLLRLTKGSLSGLSDVTMLLTDTPADIETRRFA